jgi:hypothetical protein
LLREDTHSRRAMNGAFDEHCDILSRLRTTGVDNWRIIGFTTVRQL